MNLYQWLCLFGIPTIIAFLISITIKSPIEKRIKKQEDALLRDRLLQAFEHYESKGWASYDEKRNVENMHTQYEALGENNVMNHRYERFLALPDKPTT